MNKKINDIDYNIKKNTKRCVEEENNLLFSKPNYNLPIDSYNIQRNIDTSIRIDGVSAVGRGFGDLTVSNHIRHGVNSRLENNKFRKIQESQVINRFQHIDEDIQNPNNLILPFPRGGEITRRKMLDKNKYDIKY